MNPFSRRAAIALAAAALLSACGGGVTYPADEHASTAALMAQVNAPLPDCAADGCNKPRIVDGLAEQFRAAVIDAPPAPAAPAEPAAPAGAAPADPAGMPLTVAATAPLDPAAPPDPAGALAPQPAEPLSQGRGAEPAPDAPQQAQ